MDVRNILSVIFLQLAIPARGGLSQQCPELVQETGYHVAVHESTCYMFVDQEKFWKPASSHCLQMGGDLVAIKNAQVMNFLKKELNSRELGWSNNGVWIGARYYEDRKHWVWTTGEEVTYAYWASGEPNKMFGLFSLENCALMRRDDNWRWHDYHCGTLKYHYKYICQFPTIPVTTATPEIPSNRGTVMIVKQVDVGQGGQPTLEAIAHSYQENGQSAHSSSAGQQEDNGNMSILLIVIGLAGLVIFGMLVVFFIYRKRQRDKPYNDTIVRFENRSYGPINANENAYSTVDPETGSQRPASNMYMSPEEMNNLYEEVNKQVNHGVNSFHKETNCLSDAPPPPPPPRTDSDAGDSSECEGAVGGHVVESEYEEPTKNPLMGSSMMSEGESEFKGGNLYVDMSGGSKSSLDTESNSSCEKKKLEPTYTNTTEVKAETGNHYEEFPANKQ